MMTWENLPAVVPWAIGAVLLAAFTLSAALNLALRIPSRARFAAEFERGGRANRLGTFVARRPHYTLATAVVRSVLTLVLFFLGARCGEVVEVSIADTRTVLTAVLMLGVLLVFGVAIPTSWAKYRGEFLVVRMLPVLEGLRWVCHPVTVALAAFDPLVRRLSGLHARDEESYADELEREIRSVVNEGELHGVVDEDEKEMIESVIDLTETRVSKIMTPRTQMVAVPVDAALDDVMELIRQRGHSRIPVYEHSIDTILGILYAKDLLLRPAKEPFKLQAFLRKALFVPETKLVRELLREFQDRKVHMAIVLDEYGGTSGLATIEDILEELVGEIVDEYDRSTHQELQRIDERTVEMDGRMTIHTLNEQLGLSFPEDRDFETIAGLFYSTLGRIPTVGEKGTYGELGFHIVAADPRRISRVRLTLPTPVPEDAGLVAE